MARTRANLWRRAQLCALFPRHRGAPTQDLDAALVAVGIVTALICAIAVLWRGLLMAASLSDAALALVLMHGAWA
jgi:hypothetical protein